MCFIVPQYLRSLFAYPDLGKQKYPKGGGGAIIGHSPSEEKKQEDYRTMILISHPTKFMLKVIKTHLPTWVEKLGTHEFIQAKMIPYNTLCYKGLKHLGIPKNWQK